MRREIKNKNVIVIDTQIPKDILSKLHDLIGTINSDCFGIFDKRGKWLFTGVTIDGDNSELQFIKSSKGVDGHNKRFNKLTKKQEIPKMDNGTTIYDYGFWKPVLGDLIK